jgi:predicted AlkP superfamily pyrophosphatase or phosphodiesterase
MLRRVLFRLFACIGCVVLPVGAAPAEPAVVLVSLDGFRYDYAAIHNAQHMKEIGAAGVVADAMVPTFPSMTFSSHYSLVTALYSDRHGIVDNAFYDPALAKEYRYAQQGREGQWYRGLPLWALAEKQGVRAAVFSGPGSEAGISGVQPTYGLDYATASRATHDQQVDQALEWLRMPDAQRPRFVGLYFVDADVAAHRFGPDSAELHAAVEKLDRAMGRLWAGLQELAVPVNLIIVSDHGMATRAETILLRDFADLTKVKVVQGAGAIVHVYASDNAVREQLYKELKGRSKSFEVYRREETPARWHYSRDPRIGDLVIVGTRPVILNGRAAEVAGTPPFPNNIGTHGYDPELVPEMNGIFYAAGPNIRSGRKLRRVNGVDIYPFIAHILGLEAPSDIDGHLSGLRSIYKR